MFNHIMHLRWKKKKKHSENREQGKPKIKKKKVSLDKVQKEKRKCEWLKEYKRVGASLSGY